MGCWVVGGRWHIGGMKFGDVPTWMAAIIAAISVFALWKSLRFNKQLIEIEVKRDLQALHVSAWASPSSSIASIQTIPTMPGFQAHLPWVKSVVANDSNQPIYNVVVSWYQIFSASTANAQPVGTTAVDLIPPGKKFEQNLRDDSITYLRRLEDAPDSYKSSEKAIEHAAYLANRVRVLVTFNDVEGTRWTRNLDGKLNSE